MTTDPTVEVVDRPDRERFVLTVDGAPAGFATYRLRGDVVTFIHTEIAPEFEGRGLGSRLAVAALDDVRRRGLRVVARCPFIARFIAGHVEYQDLLAAAPAQPADRTDPKDPGGSP